MASRKKPGIIVTIDTIFWFVILKSVIKSSRRATIFTLSEVFCEVLWRIKFKTQFLCQHGSEVLRKNAANSFSCWRLCDVIKSSRQLLNGPWRENICQYQLFWIIHRAQCEPAFLTNILVSKFDLLLCSVM